jgi:hypothetical protein
MPDVESSVESLHRYLQIPIAVYVPQGRRGPDPIPTTIRIAGSGIGTHDIQFRLRPPMNRREGPGALIPVD